LQPKAEPALVFFVDRSLGGKYVVQALRNAGAEIVVHDDVFAFTTPDIEWLAEAGKQGWIVLTKDSAIRRNPLERAMYQEARVRVFALTRKDLGGPEMAEILVRALPGIRKRAREIEPPFLFTISRGGEFARVD
jgi:predicted nuclease of predicted toxin-antitoxin system